MHKQQEKVIKPLIQQVAMRDKQIADLQQENQKLLKNLKILNAVVRSPLLSDKFAKEDRKLMSQ